MIREILLMRMCFQEIHLKSCFLSNHSSNSAQLSVCISRVALILSQLCRRRRVLRSQWELWKSNARRVIKLKARGQLARWPMSSHNRTSHYSTWWDKLTPMIKTMQAKYLTRPTQVWKTSITMSTGGKRSSVICWLMTISLWHWITPTLRPLMLNKHLKQFYKQWWS
jgi:hypothetical protein